MATVGEHNHHGAEPHTHGDAGHDVEAAHPHTTPLAQTTTATRQPTVEDLTRRISHVGASSTSPDRSSTAKEKQRDLADVSVLPAYYEKDEQIYTAREWEMMDKPPAEPPAWRKTLNRFKWPVLHALMVIVLLGWWISGLIVEATRPRWIVATIFVWFFIGLIFFKYVSTEHFSKPIEKVWEAGVSKPWFKLPYIARLSIGWVGLLALIFGSAFGTSRQGGTTAGDRAQSVFGLFVFQLVVWLSSNNKKLINWRTVIVGLGLQQIIALLVLKTSAFFDLFNWIATLAADFLKQAYPAAAFFFDQETVFDKFWFIATTLPAIIFFVAFAEMMFYAGVLQWLIKKVGWTFLKLMDISGAEATVVSATPFIGQGESACMVKPYVNTMTASEIHQMLTSGFATIAGSVLSAYIGFGMPPVYLVTSAIMSIPASIAISKMRMPEADEPLTKGRITESSEGRDAENLLHAFSNGAWFGLRVAALIFCNVLTILALVYTTNGLLTYIGRSFAINESNGPWTLELTFSYLFYPLSWLMGVPKQDLLKISGLLGTKLVANEFVAYLALSDMREELTERGFNIAVYALCGFANLGSLGIQIGVLSALGPKRKRVIAKVAMSALLCGFLTTCQTANIAGQLL